MYKMIDLFSRTRHDIYLDINVRYIENILRKRYNDGKC